MGGHPLSQPPPDFPCPVALLATAGRQWVFPAPLHQIWGNGPDAVGDIQIFRESTNGLVSLCQRGASLQGQLFSERTPHQGTYCVQDPYVLLEEMHTSSTGGSGYN